MCKIKELIEKKTVKDISTPHISHDEKTALVYCINTWCTNHNVVRKGYSVFYPENVGTERKTSKGKIITRLKKYFKTKSIPWNDTIAEKLGNCLKDSVKGVNIDIVRRFGWTDGDYGDLDSCFWGDRSGVRLLLEDQGALAILAHNKDGKGVGRCFGIPYAQSKNKTLIGKSALESEKPVNVALFNAYGYPLSAFATMLSTITGLEASPISLENHGDVCGFFYINNEGSGYSVGPDNFSDLDFGFYTDDYEHYKSEGGDIVERGPDDDYDSW